MYKPLDMFGDKVQAIRHVFSPSIALVIALILELHATITMKLIVTKS